MTHPTPPRSPLPLLPVQFPGAPRPPEPLPPSPPVPGHQWAALVAFSVFWTAGFGIWMALAPENQSVLGVGMLWSLTLAGLAAAASSAWLVLTAVVEVARDRFRPVPPRPL